MVLRQLITCHFGAECHNLCLAVPNQRYNTPMTCFCPDYSYHVKQSGQENGYPGAVGWNNWLVWVPTCLDRLSGT